jgi:hypothetical protein
MSVWTGITLLRKRPVVGSVEHGSETSVAINSIDCFDKLSDC